ncbi:dephospho-CoA kinase [Halomonas sp. MCCC 1A17488]|uniref:dephospho-CoA kinase n=1 Tax=unclassified Halomonas TaxID=2609666 RepID=UPI0018D265E6|nr:MULTISPECIES: dephospho-CoA kinase [unclassified Halomonas]MCE8014946.1 dephospho-CoA kinase [Halomonas sp. MCCC 1A17488]MCG3238279.1 dephospho-CoA kinase [Halomonas sp. MCCC 1A17488]QPP47963.1 dephospho-CoA kinase [Halomonas sp. SS10-MC5]
MIVGVTGGIASGKSTVARAFAALGIPWVDADDVAREVVEPGEPALAEIAARFGGQVLQADGSLNRRALREIVFADPNQRLWLESVTHPRIRQRILAHLERLQRTGAPYVLLVSPLLFESGQSEMVDRCLVIDVPESVQLARTAARDDVDEKQARAILAAQMPRSERLARADDVIDNSGSEAALAAQVAELDRRYRELAENR